jgi:hypothetical protein
VELYIKVVKTIITLTTILRGALIAFKIVVNVVPLVYVKFVARTVVVFKSIYYKNKNEKRITLNTEIMIGF